MKFSPKCFLIASWTICTLGLVSQLTLVSLSYFKFETDSKVNVAPHFSIKAPSLSTCFRVVDILDPIKVKAKYKNLSVYRSDHPDFRWYDFGRFSSVASVKDLFEFTPGVDSVIFAHASSYGCMIRFPKKHIMRRFNASACYDYLKVTKYHHREYICYKFSPRGGTKEPSMSASDQMKYLLSPTPPSGKESSGANKNLDANRDADEHSDASLSVKGPSLTIKILDLEDYALKDSFFGLIYSIRLNSSKFNGAQIVTNYIHEPETLTLYDSLLAFMTKLVSGYKSWVTVGYSTLVLHRLAPPYDTNCFQFPPNRGQLDQSLLYINKLTMRRLGKVIPDIMIHETDKEKDKKLIADYGDANPDGASFQDANLGDASNYPVLTTQVLESNETLARIYEEITSLDLYKPSTCVIKSTNPRSVATPDDSLSIGVTWPDQYHIEIRHDPKSQLIDFLVYICSCLGFWFGISIFSFLDGVLKRIMNSKHLKIGAITTDAKLTDTKESDAQKSQGLSANYHRLQTQFRGLRILTELRLRQMRQDQIRERKKIYKLINERR